LGVKNWNLAIRRAQEVVELVSKAMLAELGVDYPKIHDVAPVLKKAVENRGIKGSEDFFVWLLDFSAKLSARRAPAFYFEAEYTKEDAMIAVKGADKVIKFGRSFIKSMRK
jgi:hypothetical protein